MSKWSQNEFTRGSFSGAVIGTDDTAYRNIACRLGPLFFAGEGTSEKRYGYVQGGYYTGKDKANAIAKYIKWKELNG